MGEIRGIALIGYPTPVANGWARRTLRIAHHHRLPIDLLWMQQPLFDLDLGDAARDRLNASSTADQEFLDVGSTAALSVALVDDFRWRAWVAQAMGGTLILCPDVQPAQARSLTRMGMITIEYRPETSRADLDRAARSLGIPVDEVAVCDTDDAVVLRTLRLLAGQLITSRYEPGSHERAAALRSSTGRTWTGLELMIDGKRHVCAEAAALSRACESGAVDLTYLAVVGRRSGSAFELVEPCPHCSRALATLSPSTRLVLADRNGAFTAAHNSQSSAPER